MITLIMWTAIVGGLAAIAVWVLLLGLLLWSAVDWLRGRLFW